MPSKILLPLFGRFTNSLGLSLLLVSVISCSTTAPTHEVITAKVVLDRIANRLPVQIENVTFSDDLDFTSLPGYPETEAVSGVTIESPIYFKNCTFNGKVLAFRQQNGRTLVCHFGRNLTFINCRFNNDTRFQSVSVAGICSFSRTQFNRPISFEGARFGAETYFDQVLFATEARFQQASFNKLATFWQSVWAGPVYFQGAVFQADAQFNQSDFRANNDFSLCTTYGLLNFNYAKLTGRTVFNDCKFRNAVDFSNTTLNETSFEGAFFEAKALFADVSTTRLSFRNSFFLTQRPSIQINDGKETLVDYSAAQIGATNVLSASR